MASKLSIPSVPCDMGATAQQKEALVETPLVNDTSQPTTSGADSEVSEGLL